jgi:hypothetical protein
MTRKVVLSYEAVMRLARECGASVEEMEKIKKYFHDYDPDILSKMPNYEGKKFTFEFPLKYKPTARDYIDQILSHIDYIEQRRKERDEVKEKKKETSEEIEKLRKEAFQSLKEKYFEQIEILEEKIKKSISLEMFRLLEEEGLKPPALYYLERAKDLIEFVQRVETPEKIQEIIKAIEINLEKTKRYIEK